MLSSESVRSLRGNLANRIVAARYDGTISEFGEIDVILSDLLLEVKTVLDLHVGNYDYLYPGRISINADNHRAFKKRADALGKQAVYVFFKVPRYSLKNEENNPEKWIEAWVKWEDVNRLIKSTNRYAKNYVRKQNIMRHYYRIYVDEIFGKN